MLLVFASLCALRIPLAANLGQVRAAVEQISDPVERIAVSNELVGVLWDALGAFSSVRLDAVADATRDKQGPRELERLTGISNERITQFRNKLRKQGRFPNEGNT